MHVSLDGRQHDVSVGLQLRQRDLLIGFQLRGRSSGAQLSCNLSSSISLNQKTAYRESFLLRRQLREKTHDGDISPAAAPAELEEGSASDMTNQKMRSRDVITKAA